MKLLRTSEKESDHRIKKVKEVISSIGLLFIAGMMLFVGGGMNFVRTPLSTRKSGCGLMWCHPPLSSSVSLT